jgi:hypothetical protein
MKAAVSGMIATFPLGGVAWDYGQYALGLERLGYEVTYLEDTGVPSYSRDPASGLYREDPSDGIEFLRSSLARLSPTLALRWHVRAADGTTYGMALAALLDTLAEADVLINVSGSCLLRPEYRRAVRRAIFIDTDPGWNHLVILPRWDEKPPLEREMGFRGHDAHFTYAGRLGAADCPLPDLGLAWRPTRPPVVVDEWSAEPSTGRWTTVTMWGNYLDTVQHGGRTYGSKDIEFRRFEDVPQRTSAQLELAIYGDPQRSTHFGDAPRERWREMGWSVINGADVSASLDDYRGYIERSRGEFSVAKNVYVDTRSGWFSCRSVCYLAAGLPVVLQDTGWSHLYPAGEGLLAFDSVATAAAALNAVEADYERHAASAAQLVREHFDARTVLEELVEQAVSA